MAYVTKYVYRELYNLFQEHKDPRVQHFPMVGTPIPMICILSTYLAFVLHYGPKWMENRKPFNLKYVMRVYNALQVIANVFLFVYGLQNSYLRKEFSLTCQPVDHINTTPWMWKLLYATYGYYITKYLDLLDTIFFVLRKKTNQISFLHVYHHSGMVLGVYVFMAFMAGSHSTMLGVINLFIHTIMYAYYFVTSVRPVKRALWWKRHITQLQLLQFGYLMLHYLMVIVYNHCQHPVFPAFVGLIQNLFMFALFFDFYYREYMRKPQPLGGAQQKKVQLPLEKCNSAIQSANVTEQKLESLQEARVTQATEQLNSCGSAASTMRTNTHVVPCLLKAKCS